MKEFFRRAGWAMLALLFVVTGLGVGVYAFWQNVHSPNTNNQPASTNQLAGKPLANFTPVSDVTKLQIIDQKVGSGQVAKAGSNVVVDYTGAIAATGTIFQSSKDFGKPASLNLDQVIKGWQQGIPGMKVGGDRRLIIPGNLAYGSNPPPGSGIPPNAPLVFDIHLIKIE